MPKTSLQGWNYKIAIAGIVVALIFVLATTTNPFGKIADYLINGTKKAQISDYVGIKHITDFQKQVRVHHNYVEVISGKHKVRYLDIDENNDFEEYKTLLAYYNSLQGYVDAVNLTQAEIDLNSVNLFTYLSAEIDVMYSFNDSMVPDNIFGMSLSPTYTTSLSDNIGTVGSTYDERGFVIKPYDITTETAYYIAPSQFGDFFFDANTDPGGYGHSGSGEIVGELINPGGTYTQIAPGYNYWGIELVQPTEYPSSTIYNDDFIPTSNPHNNVNDEINPAIIQSVYGWGNEQKQGYIVPDQNESPMTEQWDGSAVPHAQHLDEAKGDMNGDTYHIRGSMIGRVDQWKFTNIQLPAFTSVSKLQVHAYAKLGTLETIRYAEVRTSVTTGVVGSWQPSTASYGWYSFWINGLTVNHNEMNDFWLSVTSGGLFVGLWKLKLYM
ncbi:hypothetical protein LCGC14_1761780 [marine sediment metagenome]|uniref:Uncharacterized protein n=1 Tax=marine sediment metagenome TaxID=412755 RepID=A0A0F9K0G0_9ZZZZ